MDFKISRINQVLAKRRPSLQPSKTQAGCGLDKAEISSSPARVGRPLLRSLAAISLLAAAGCAGVQPSVLNEGAPPGAINKAAEHQILSQGDACGELVPLTTGQPGQGVHLSIHGLGAGPDRMQPVIDQAASEGKATTAFLYDDMHCSQLETRNWEQTEKRSWDL